MPISGHFWNSTSIVFLFTDWRAFFQTTPTAISFLCDKEQHPLQYLSCFSAPIFSFLPLTYMGDALHSFHLIRIEEQRGHKPLQPVPNALGRKHWMKPRSNEHLPYLLWNTIAKGSCSLTVCSTPVVFQPQTSLRQIKKKKGKNSLLPAQYY